MSFGVQNFGRRLTERTAQVDAIGPIAVYQTLSHNRAKLRRQSWAQWEAVGNENEMLDARRYRANMKPVYHLLTDFAEANRIDATEHNTRSY
jgi:hypothetical protein